MGAVHAQRAAHGDGFSLYYSRGSKTFWLSQSAAGRRPPLASLYGVAGTIEFAGGILLLLGLFTHPVALILSGEMAVAYFKVHAPKSFWPMLNDGESAVFFCFIFLYLMFAGAGPWSLDALWLGH